MVEPNHKTENHDYEPLKGCPAAEARPEFLQYATDFVYHEALLYREVYDVSAKVFGAVLINVWPTLTFFSMAETIESRSNWTS